MRKRMLIATIFSSVMTVAVLAGCSSTSDKAGTVAASSDVTLSSETSAAVDTGKSSKTSGEITLKVFDEMAYGIDGYDKVIAAFEAENPGVKVDVQHAANDGATILQSRFNSGDIPDVFCCEPGAGAQAYYEYAYDWSNDKDVLSKFKDGVTDLGKDTTDGKIKGLPWTYENMGLIYNKECFLKAGITTLPTTMDELASDCEKLKSVGIQPISLAAKENWVLGQLLTHFMIDKKVDAQGTVDEITAGKLKVKDMPNMDNFFKFLDLVKKYDSPKVLETSWEDSENNVANGKAAILHMGDWAQANFSKDNPDCDLAFLPVPVGKTADDCTVLSSVGWVYMVNKDSKNLDIAKKYEEFILTSNEAQEWMTNSEIGVDGVPCCLTDKAPSGCLPKDAQNYINGGKTNGWMHTILSSDYSSTVGPLIQGYLGGTSTKDDVMSGIQDYFDSIAK